MNQETLTQLQVNHSDFIYKYVEEHKEELEELRAKANSLAFDGEWVIIGDDEYPQKRIQYATTSFPEEYVSPRIILYPTGDQDIQKAIDLCRELKMAIAVRTGGHQYCGYSSTLPENMQIDLSETFPQYDYDAEANVLRCGVSHALGDWAELNHKHGIYLPMGVCANVHLGGHVHTGGWGIVARSHGLLADHVLGFDIILANGEKKHIVRPKEGETNQDNDDLYYAVLGGSKGGDFGIVTHWEFSPLRDQDYPNSACYTFTWLWSKNKMEGAVRKMAELSKLCAEGKIPSDYEFMLNITGFGKMDLLPEFVKDGLRSLGIIGAGNMDLLSDTVKDELRELGITGTRHVDLLSNAVKDELRELGITTIEKMDWLPEIVKDDLRELGILNDGIWVPPLIQMWMCFTNKEGKGQQFDDQWFESFTEEDVCGKPLVAHRLKKTPVSKGLAEHFIMKQDREMEYPFVKRFRATMDLPEEFPQTYTKRMYEIMGLIGTRNGQHLVSQQQIYAGGAVAENGKAGITSYSWREQALAMSHDSFYLESWFHPEARETAELWQCENDEAFVEQKGFADKDMRMVAYTFGNRVLDEVWPYYYDSEEKYKRLRKIKGKFDPNHLFSADEFSLKPL
ncbi:FAD-binding protein [Okeania sp. SIO2B3]|uniref:FAD-dependent oxidoreductase n=1 Tax=Okeania sp. SIO2B3 TaxID=2607784 RepID=UPI0013C06EB0|nr:FAD-binding protein [Okeania sp. SIO2B3]NET45840.1 FAD-dependent oxidoreductase [Okeania sp. SIO2B3]